MVTKSTILSKNDAFLLEEAILKYGQLVRFEDLKKIFSKRYSEAEIRNHISALTKKGWLVRIKRGLFVLISDISSLYFNNISLLRISNALNEDSYISLDAALNYYSLFDQLMKTVSAVTVKRTKKYQFQNFIFRFLKVNKRFYFGYSERRVEGKIVKIADLEKIIIDYLYLKKDDYTLDLIWEKLNNFKSRFDFDKMKFYTMKSNITIKREIGFLLDQLHIQTGDIHKAIKNEKGYSRFTASSEKFNSHWRIYYNDRIIK